MNVLAWTVPNSKIQAARELLLPFLPHHPDVQFLTSINNHQSQFLLHPRIQSQQDLPTDLVARFIAWGAQVDNHRLDSLSPTTIEQLWTILFFSGSKRSPALQPHLPDTWRRVLSNFYPTSLIIEGTPYASVEHFFQSQKALTSSKPEMAHWFAANFSGPEAVIPEASAAKKAGSRKAYTHHGAILDMRVWDERRVDCMRLALRCRYAQDNLFRQILESTQGMKLLHFERSGARSFWGGNFSRQTGKIVGQNKLGLLMMDMRDEPIS